MTKNIEKESMDQVYSILNIGGTKITENSKTVYASGKSIDQMTYAEQTRLDEFTNYGYQNYFDYLTQENSLGEGKQLTKEQSQSIMDTLKEVPKGGESKEARATKDFILNGGNPFASDIQQETIQNQLADAIRQTKGIENKSAAVELAKNWFSN